ncbi:SpoIIE family protein phosphatase [Microbispora sp. NBC_01389]|uniref:SpoIIE family protein phosphatase n=1 Tax=Microbispora sp. NBC_01389 TaxID=2903584 RepID=UPI0032434231
MVSAIKVDNPVVVSAAIAVAAVVVVLGAVWQERYKAAFARQDAARHALQDGCLVLADGQFPRVNQIRDPVALGVHRAIALSGDSTAPTYIPRDQDAALRECLSRAGFILLVGHSTSGKSRAAFEALQSVLPDHLLIVPRDQGALPAAIDRAAQSRKSVLWLNDLERYLRPGGLTRDHITRLVAGTDHHRVILATLRSLQRAEMLQSQAALGDAAQLGTRQVREVLDQAHEVHLDRRFSPDELDRARQLTDDLRIEAALRHADEYGIAEYLASGPALQRRYADAWDGPNPRGAALVAAAIDCFHAGFTKPLPKRMLEELHEEYLAERGGRLLLPEPLEAAWEWATIPMPGTTTALLSPTGSGDFVTVFDYLVDVKQQTEGPRRRISASLAATALAYASGPDALSIATILDQTDMAVVVLDRFGNALRWNPFAEQVFGPHELGSPPSFLTAMGEKDGMTAAGIIFQVCESGCLWEGTLEGAGARVRTQAMPLTGVTGQVTGVVLFARSAPDDFAQERLALVEEIGHLLNAATDLTEGLQEVIDVLVPRLGDRCLIRIESRQVSVPDIWPADAPPEEILTPTLMNATNWCDRVGVKSAIITPLRARGANLGLLALGSTTRVLSLPERDLISVVASRVELFADNALLLEQQAETARELIRHLLPRYLPGLDGLDTALRYYPGHSTQLPSQMSSDWWDIIPLSAGRVAFVVGDVEGRGPRAAALMGQLRVLLGTLAHAELPPAEILTRLDEWTQAMTMHSESVAPPIVTCQYLVYDPWLRQLSYASAGHAPPLLLHEGVCVELDITEVGPPLGISSVDPRYKEVTRTLPSGSALLLYTDGLVVRRSNGSKGGLWDATDVLLKKLSAVADAPVERIADAATIAVPGDPDDDMVILVLRTSNHELDEVVRTFPAEPATVAEAVTLVSSTLSTWQIHDEQIRTASSLVKELVTNAVQHAVGKPFAESEFTLRVRRGAQSVWVDVFDQDLRMPRLADQGEPGPTGLRLVGQLAKRWGARPARNGKSVWFEISLGLGDVAGS